MKAEEFIKSEQNGVLLNDYTLQDMIWFMTEFAKKKVSEQLTIPVVVVPKGTLCLYCEENPAVAGYDLHFCKECWDNVVE
jgi:hypothetical protein